MSKNNRLDSYQRGIRAEQFSKYWLRLKGYRILAERFRVPVGEIDLIVMKGSIIAAVEVKARASLQQSLECITIKQRKRIERAFMWYLKYHRQSSELTLRFDMLLVAPWRIKHIKNAWQINY